MNYPKLFFITVFFLSLKSSGAFAQSDTYFEGVLYTHSITIDAKGISEPFIWEEVEEYYDENHILTRITKGRVLDHTDRCDIYLDNEKNSKLKINHNTHLISKLPVREAKDISPLEFKKLREEVFLGHLCDVYFIKYIDPHEDIQDIIGPVTDALSCTYYIAKDLKIKNPKRFAKLQENHSTSLLDGRFEGLALKIILEHTDGEKLVVMGTKIELKDVQDVMTLPPYPFQN
jgi:hypothetical protein